MDLIMHTFLVANVQVNPSAPKRIELRVELVSVGEFDLRVMMELCSQRVAMVTVDS